MVWRTALKGLLAGIYLVGGYAVMHVAGGWLFPQGKPVVTAEVLLRDLASIPMYQSLDRADPEAYARLASEIATVVANGEVAGPLLWS